MLSALVVGYLFLGGTGAGACAVLAVLGMLAPRECVAVEPIRLHGRMRAHAMGVRGAVRVSAPYRRFLGSGYAAALVALVAGAVCLLADLGRADRLLLLVVQPQPSFIAVGAWSLAALAAVALFLALVWGGMLRHRIPLGVLRALEGASLVVAAVAMAYTGLLLGSMPSVPLWATPWLPVLFALSALSCGIALIVGAAQFSGAFRRFKGVLRRLMLADAVVIVLEAAVAALFLASVWDSASGATATAQVAGMSLRELAAGEGAWLFWGGFVAVGLAVPLASEAVLVRLRRPAPLASVAVAACVLAGGAVMRACIVGAGLQPAAIWGMMG